ncbi:agmatine deiminase family protein [Enterococcus faecalis]|nr:agmatine deiminase family protein [Enterococcus faecalis]
MNDDSQFPVGKIVMQPAMSYCNFLIVNGIVLGQKYWTERLPESIKGKVEIARQTLEGLFPNRRVVMIHITALNILSGGIHCITKKISL